ncbi:MAG: hypothetical protein HYY93_02830 [Planctomycetes bacterium]|nr:hypothetical protein [Planctomycetota bacterium]
MNRATFFLVLVFVLWLAIGAAAPLVPLLPFDDSGPGALPGALSAWILGFLLFVWPMTRERADRPGEEPRVVGWITEAVSLTIVASSSLMVARRIAGPTAWEEGIAGLIAVLLGVLVSAGTEGYAAAWPRAGRGGALALLALGAVGGPALDWIGADVGQPPLGDWWKPFAPFEALVAFGDPWHGMSLGTASAMAAVVYAAIGLVMSRRRRASS